MTRYEIKDPDSGEVVGSYCADKPVSAETRAALEALARAARKDLVEVPPPLPAEPPNGFVGRLGKVVWVRMWRGDSDPARWCEPGNPARFTWEQVCGFRPDEQMIELRPDPAVESPDLPWIYRVDDGVQIHVDASHAWRDRLFVEVDSTHLERDTVRQLAAVLCSWLAAADQAEFAALRAVRPEGETKP